ncbi:CHC2 zinc finger domain-containing protein, partial [Parabacteroides distasonis]
MIDRATVDKIIDAANIVDVVSDFVTLRKAGVNYKGLCPFHDDKNPSVMVSPTKNICHCFVCGKGGTPAGFLMEHEQMTYPDALRWLARKYNIEIEERELSDDEKRAASERDSMYIVNEWAKGYFHDLLLNDNNGQS